MAWLILVRLVFLVGVAYSTAEIQPLPWGWVANAVFGGVLAAAAVALEWRMRDVSVPHLLGAVLGASLGVLFAHLLGRAMGVTSDVRWIYVHRVIDLVFPYVGLVVRARRGEWLVDEFRNRNKDRRFVLVSSSVAEDGVSVIAAVSPSLAASLKAPEIMKQLGLRGGGRPDFAQGGGVEPGEVEALREKARAVLRGALEERHA